MDNKPNATLTALRDFFLARTGDDLSAACATLASNGGPEGFTADWEAAEFVFNKLFVGPKALQAPPYASYYLEPEPQLMGRSTLRVRRLYEMAGLVSPLEGRLPCDHLGVELDAALGILAMVDLSDAEEPRALWRYFRDEHLKAWAPLFIEKARQADDGHPAIDLALDRLEAWLDEQGNGEEEQNP